MNRIHVCMREPYARPGGLHSYVRGLVSGQRSIGLEPAVVDSITAKGKYNVADGVLPEFFQANDGSVIEYHFAHGALPFVMPARGPWTAAKRIFHFHGPWHQEGLVQGNSRIRILLKKTLESTVYSKFSRFIVASDYFGRVLSHEFGVETERITTVHPGVDTERFSPSASMAAVRASMGLPQDAFVAAIVRRLEPRMGIIDALRAAREIPDLFLIIAGTGSLDAELKSAAVDLGISHRVRFLGKVADSALPLVYQAANVSVVPTRELEGFGMIVLESMACGTPVVATSVGGLPEAMGPFADEWTVGPRSPKGLADKLRVVFDSPQLRTEVRTFALKRSNAQMAHEVEAALVHL